MDTSKWEALDRLLEFLPIFEDPSFVPATWPDRSYIGKDGKKVMGMPYPDYHPKVEEFRDCYPAFAGEIHPYNPLPEDETSEGVPFNVMGTSFTEEYFANASLDQVRRYLMLLGRGEHFADGHIAGEFKAGKIVMALRRLAALRDETV